MSFLIVNNGQFAPLITSSVSERGVPAISSLTGLNQVNEFRNTLAESTENDHLKKSLQRLEVYKVAEKKFEKQRKRFYAKDIMSSPVKLISHHALAIDARAILSKCGFRHLPVVNEQQLIIGMISDGQLVGNLENKTCADIMLKTIIVCEEQASINEIAIILLREKINALPIINSQREIMGIITLSDILKFVIDSTMFLTNA